MSPLVPVHARPVHPVFGLSATPDEVANVGPPPEPRDGFITFFDRGWSIARLQATVVAAFWGETIFHEGCWCHKNETFFTAEDVPCYRQIRNGPLPDSFTKYYPQKVKLLPEGEEVPQARDVVNAAILHYLATGERLFTKGWVLCSSAVRSPYDDSHYHVGVGCFGSAGLRIDLIPDDSRGATTGLASARKL